MACGKLGNQTIAGLCAILVFVGSSQSNASAEEAPGISAAHTTHAEFDLSSTALTMAAAAPDKAEIRVAETTVSVIPGTVLTAAEYVAYQQVLNGGSQTLVLGTQGQAVGGSFNLSAIAAQQVSNLVVPGNVTAIHDAAVAQSIVLTGNLTNAGSI